MSKDKVLSKPKDVGKWKVLDRNVLKNYKYEDRSSSRNNKRFGFIPPE